MCFLGPQRPRKDRLWRHHDCGLKSLFWEAQEAEQKQCKEPGAGQFQLLPDASSFFLQGKLSKG